MNLLNEGKGSFISTLFFQIFALVLLLVTSSSVFSQAVSNAIVGKYLSQDAKGKIEIYKTGNAFSGKLYWLREPIDPLTNSPKTDLQNPDKNKRNRPLAGLIILVNLQFNNSNKWENGKIYDPKTGKTWDCDATLNGDKLKLTGYWKTTLFGRTEIWTRTN